MCTVYMLHAWNGAELLKWYQR